VAANLSEMAGAIRRKTDYCFYAIDEKNQRSAYLIPQNHVIMIPKQAVERLQNDSQLAAVIAEGLAETMQSLKWFSSATGLMGSKTLGVDIHDAPVGTIGAGGYTLVPDRLNGKINEEETPQRDQRDRIALILLSDAGYDPNQAPEAWRLLFPDNAATNMQTLPYPQRSIYQLNVIATLHVIHNPQ
jgi:hypothetical protein